MAIRAIVNADDFGWSVGVTDGILLAHRQGLVTSTTLAVNMPDAPRAIQLARDLPSLGVGVHLNACQGTPLSAEGRAVLADDDGVMRLKADDVIRRCLKKRSMVAAVLAEFEAQIRQVLVRGLHPTHLDSHRHVHAWPPILAGVVELAHKYGIRFLRRPAERLEKGFPKPPRKQARTAALLRMLDFLAPKKARPLQVSRGTWGIAHTGLIDRAWLILAGERLRDGLTEIMVHPGFSKDLDGEQTRLIASRQAELEALCDGAVKAAWLAANVERVHYGQIGS